MKKILIAGFAVILFTIAYFDSGNFSEDTLHRIIQDSAPTESVQLADEISEIITPTDQNSTQQSITPSTETEIVEYQSVVKYQVVKVVDGDTVDVRGPDGETKRLRLIGVDTPETVHPTKPVECFGKQASDFTRTTLFGQIVTLESDESQGAVDKYGRTLAYIILADGMNFNNFLIASGYAYEYTYNTPYRYQDEFRSAQKLARENGDGLWGEGCAD